MNYLTFLQAIAYKKNKHLQMEKAMAPPLQYSCLENPMDGGTC